MQTTTRLILKSLKRKRAEREESFPVRDRILSLLADNGGETRRNRIRDRLQVRLAILDPVLEELENEGKISIALGQKGGTIALRKTRP